MSNIVKKESAGALVKYTKETFLKEFAPRVCMVKLHSVNTIEKAIKSDLKSIAKVCKSFGREFIINYLQLWIIDLNEFLNLTNKMSKEQIKDTAELLYLDNHNLNMADINIIFTNAKKGVYGQLYGSIDGMKILSWFKKYNWERADWYFENVTLHEHEGIKKHGALRWHDLNNRVVTTMKQLAENKTLKKE